MGYRVDLGVFEMGGRFLPGGANLCTYVPPLLKFSISVSISVSTRACHSLMTARKRGSTPRQRVFLLCTVRSARPLHIGYRQISIASRVSLLMTLKLPGCTSVWRISSIVLKNDLLPKELLSVGESNPAFARSLGNDRRVY